MRSALLVMLWIGSIWFSQVTPSLSADAAPKSAEFVRLDQDQAKMVRVVSQTLSPDGHSATIVLVPIKDRFSLDLSMKTDQLKNVKIVLQEVRELDQARFFPDARRVKRFLDLNATRGVDIDYQDNATVIEFFKPRTAKMLPPGGRLAFQRTYDSRTADERKKDRQLESVSRRVKQQEASIRSKR